ncbi:hypothetical protein VP01_2958g4 [Puccinia sorghi]|uniref:Uncharacterized protein n=1 Tax=Puccinia sorghi TaxID=27349 RepID=A0A0L6V0X3_9BASI|nr:hypothetical protein VP01_2958g4 [Puccinia sorghi]
MKINQKYATNLQLLIPAYNHYEHFLQTNRFNREKHQLGKFCQDEERKVIKRARDRLRDAQLQFALARSLPKQYQKIISNINSHSDDEYNPKKRNYTIKTLKFRSENSTKFFCCLDAAMLASDALENKRVQRRLRVPPPTPQESLFPQPPKGLPLNFYKPKWFNELLPQQKLEIANTCEVAFLPDASKSLMGKQAPSEKLSDKKFTQTFFDCLSVPYDLTHEIENDPDDEESTDKGDSSYAGPEEDLDNTSGEDEESDQDWDHQEEQEDEDHDDSDREERYNAMVLDQDCVW